MRNRGGRGVILPLLVVLFTSVVLVVGGRVGSAATAEPGPARPLAAAPGVGGAPGGPAASDASPNAGGPLSTPAPADGSPGDGAAGAPTPANVPVAAPGATAPSATAPAETPAPIERKL